jgi:hypothetical protein
MFVDRDIALGNREHLLRAAQHAIVQHLRPVYEPALHEPLPDEMLDLLVQVERRQGDDLVVLNESAAAGARSTA